MNFAIQAKTGQGVQKTFEKLWRNMPHDLDAGGATASTTDIGSTKAKDNKKGCCGK